MANLIAKHQQGTLLPFVKARKLADDGTRFCIDHAKLKNQDGRDRWFLDIHYIEDGEVVYQTLTLDSSPDRDVMFQDIVDSNDYPQHNAYLQLNSFKGKDGMMRTSYKTFHDAKSKTCSCSAIALPIEEDEDEHPL